MRSVRAEYGRTDRIVIVGGGPAGWAAAGELRRLGFPGELTVISGEPEGPYDRTACSKGLLNGHQKPRDLRLDLNSCPDVHWRLGVHAVGLDPIARRILLDTGEAVAFDGLVIASGTSPSYPKGWPQDEPGLHLLHSIPDSWAFRRDLHRARRVAIVGGGLTGCEVACTTVALAREAVIINSQPYLMPRAVGDQVGALITAAHQASGIETRLGRRVAGAGRYGNQWRLVLDDGDQVFADVVVVTAGEHPDVAWLAGSGIDTSDGVLCDETLRVVGADGIVAAGALARWPNLRYGTKPARVGQWITALETGQASARTLLYGRDAVGPVTLLPRFWSDQRGLRIQVAGQLSRNAEVWLTELRPDRLDTARSGVVASYAEGGRLTGIVSVNAPRAFTVATRTLLANPLPVQPAEAVAPDWTGERRLRAVR